MKIRPLPFLILPLILVAVLSMSQFWSWSFYTESVRGGTLILVGYILEGFTLATDGFSSTDGEVQKIVPLGQCGAVVLAGDTKIVARRLRDGVAVGEIDLAALTRQWALQHPNIDLRTANDLLTDATKKSLTEFYSRHKTTGPPPKKAFHTILAGYLGDKPLIFTNSFRAPLIWGLPARVEPGERQFSPGAFLMFSTPKVCNELIENSTDKLGRYKAHPAIEMFRERKRLLQGDRWTLDEFLMVSEVCLKATESKEGRAFDSEAYNVAPPNLYATITPGRCFEWEPQPPPPKEAK